MFLLQLQYRIVGIAIIVAARHMTKRRPIIEWLLTVGLKKTYQKHIIFLFFH